MTASTTDTAVVFPGQGSQQPGMGAAFYDAWPETRALFADLADAVAGTLDLHDLCFEADEESLRATDRTQPTVFSIGLATYVGLREHTGIEPQFVAGHSLGHFTALAASGVLDPADGVQLVSERGRLMAKAARETPGGVMYAVLLADPDLVTETCAAYPDVSVAAFNAPRETVISGPNTAVSAVREELQGATRARFRKLETDTAFHSPLMQPVQDAFPATLAATDLRTGEIPIVSDISETVYTDPAVAATELTAQVTSPIDWVGTVRTLRDRGITRCLELPPAGTLGRLIERIEPDMTVITLETPDDAEELR